MSHVLNHVIDGVHTLMGRNLHSPSLVTKQQIIDVACRVALYFLEKEHHAERREQARTNAGVLQVKPGLHVAQEPPTAKAMSVHEWPHNFDIYIDDGIPPDHVYVMDSNGQRKAYCLRPVGEPAEEGQEAVSVLPDGSRREDDGEKQS